MAASPDAETVPVRHGSRPRRAERPVGAGTWVLRVVFGALLVGALIVGGTAFRVWQVARVDDRRPADAIVVLGAAQYDGDPSSVFAARLRHAQALYEQGLAPRIVTTGGSRVGDSFTEAEAGRSYLISRGVPAAAVVALPVGSDTLGSLQAVAERAAAEGWSSALLVSDPWHSLRARLMARDSGLEAWTSPTRSGPVVQTRETQIRYIVRETGALLYYHLTHASVDTETSGLG
ncbi:MAG: YdcF family protein [Pseudonocardia sp.]|nr:YdcF family protein [Pseudonocardia sp.]